MAEIKKTDKRRKRHPQIVEKHDGGLAVAVVEFGSRRPVVYWDRLVTLNLNGRTKEEILAEIDRFRSRIAGQETLLYHEADHE